MNRLLLIFVFQGYGNQLTDGQNNFLRFRRETDDFTVGVFGISELGNTEEVVFAVYQRYGQKGNRRVVIGIVEFGNQIGVYTGGLKNVRRIDDFAVQRAVFRRGFAAAVFDVGQKHRRKKAIFSVPLMPTLRLLTRLYSRLMYLLSLTEKKSIRRRHRLCGPHALPFR